jgi:purine-binding chemotaxis protein CheW
VSTAAVTEGQTRQFVVFTLGSEEYGVPITSVQEIIRYAAPRPIPGSPSHVEGVINLRGRIIPVVDLKARFGAYGDRRDEAKIVIVDLAETTVGIIVDDVTEVLSVQNDQTEPPPPGSAGSDVDYIEAVAKLEGRLLVMLDLGRLFGQVEGAAW